MMRIERLRRERSERLDGVARHRFATRAADRVVQMSAGDTVPDDSRKIIDQALLDAFGDNTTGRTRAAFRGRHFPGSSGAQNGNDEIERELRYTSRSLDGRDGAARRIPALLRDARVRQQQEDRLCREGASR